MSLTVRSSAFEEGGTIPRKSTCDGSDLSPPLTWDGVPEGARCLALICDDPDAPAGTWVHWVFWGIPADAGYLEEGVPTRPELPSGARQGTNDFGKPGYGGPCPPPGAPHRYYFKLYALDAVPDLDPGASRSDLEKAMEGHVLAEGQIMGRYARQ